MARTGRPPKPEAERQTETIRLTLKAADDALIRRAVERSGLKLAAWLRDRALRAARRELR